MAAAAVPPPPPLSAPASLSSGLSSSSWSVQQLLFAESPPALWAWLQALYADRLLPLYASHPLLLRLVSCLSMAALALWLLQDAREEVTARLLRAAGVSRGSRQTAGRHEEAAVEAAAAAAARPQPALDSSSSSPPSPLPSSASASPQQQQQSPYSQHADCGDGGTLDSGASLPPPPSSPSPPPPPSAGPLPSSASHLRQRSLQQPAAAHDDQWEHSSGSSRERGDRYGSESRRRSRYSEDDDGHRDDRDRERERGSRDRGERRRRERDAAAAAALGEEQQQQQHQHRASRVSLSPTQHLSSSSQSSLSLPSSSLSSSSSSAGSHHRHHQSFSSVHSPSPLHAQQQPPPSPSQSRYPSHPQHAAAPPLTPPHGGGYESSLSSLPSVSMLQSEQSFSSLSSPSAAEQQQRAQQQQQQPAAFSFSAPPQHVLISEADFAWTLARGCELVKYGQYGSPHVRWFQLQLVNGVARLSWGEPLARSGGSGGGGGGQQLRLSKSVALSDILDIKQGKTTAVFKQGRNDKLATDADKCQTRADGCTRLLGPAAAALSLCPSLLLALLRPPAVLCRLQHHHVEAFAGLAGEGRGAAGSVGAGAEADRARLPAAAAAAVAHSHRPAEARRGRSRAAAAAREAAQQHTAAAACDRLLRLSCRALKAMVAGCLFLPPLPLLVLFWPTTAASLLRDR